MKQLLFLLPLLCGACVGEQTRAAFTLRAPARTIQVAAVNRSAEHDANLERAIDAAVRRQEAADMAEWNAAEDARKPVAIQEGAPSCAVHDVDTETCESP